MGQNSHIQWTNSTWNPWYGCLKVSPGCKQCYMYHDMERYGRNPKVVTRAQPPTFDNPLKWKQPQKVFTCSWSDFFIEQADEWRSEAWDIIRQTPHTYQILTKRPELIKDRLPADWGKGWPNVWLGVSVETQEYANRRIPLLLSIPAKVRFLSCEPLLGPIDLTGRTVDGVWIDPEYAELDYGLGEIIKNEGWSIHWIIAGGESGYKPRPMQVEWVKQLRDQCQAANVPFFFKQFGGSKKIDDAWGGRILNVRTWDEFPKESTNITT